MRAADRLAAMDLRGTDVVTPWDTLPRWPDPGEACMDIYATAQLYWPALGPGKATEAARGCDRCGVLLRGFPPSGRLTLNGERVELEEVWCGRCMTLVLTERMGVA